MNRGVDSFYYSLSLVILNLKQDLAVSKSTIRLNKIVLKYLVQSLNIEQILNLMLQQMSEIIGLEVRKTL